MKYIKPQTSALAVLLASCVTASTSGLRVDACSDERKDSLIVSVTNSSQLAIEVNGDYPHLGCCAVDELSLFLVDKKGDEMPRCAFIDWFKRPERIMLDADKRVTYDVSLQALRGLYCDLDIANYSLAVNFTVVAGDSKKVVLSGSAPLIHKCAESQREEPGSK